MTSENESEYSAYITLFMILVIIVGVLGNIFVIIIFKNNKTLRNPLSLPIANLAVVDTLQSLLAINYIFSLNNEEQMLSNLLCQVQAYLRGTLVSVSTWTLLLISVNRYIKICRPKLQHLVNRRNITAGIIFSWAWGITMATPPLFGWSTYGYHPRFHACTVVEFEYPFLLLFIFSVILIPFIGISISYFQVFRYIHNKHFSMTAHTMSVHAQQRERKLSIMLGIVVVSYFCFYTPMTVTYIYEMASGKDMHQLYRLIALVIFYMNNANNPFIYGFMNQNFRISLFRLLRKKTPTNSNISFPQPVRDNQHRQQHQQQQQPQQHQHHHHQQQQQQQQQQPQSVAFPTLHKLNIFTIKIGRGEDNTCGSQTTRE